MRKSIITSYHHSFAGGSKNSSRLMHYLSQNGYDVEGYFYETPQYFNYTISKVKRVIFDSNFVYSEVIESESIKNYLIANKIADCLKSAPQQILFGANLFPYCNILLDAKIQNSGLNHSNPPLILHPVGSDIFQIGTHIKSRVKWLLDHPLVDRLITYSTSFVEDIKEYYDIKNEFTILHPFIEKESFFAISEIEKQNRRKVVGLQEDDFIIHHHSSMRKIKCPKVVIDIINKASKLIYQNTILFMVGPIPWDILKEMKLHLIEISSPNSPFKFETKMGKLTIYWTGIISDIKFLLQISDVELNASLYDSFNISLLEAMACGIPVVTSDVVGIKEHVQKFDFGYCFPTRKLSFDKLNDILLSDKSNMPLFDIDYAVSSILSLAENKKSSNIRLEASKYVAEMFDINKAGNLFDKIFSF
jgi:glycosyltransferase involved in cell wall biosynthesis